MYNLGHFPDFSLNLKEKHISGIPKRRPHGSNQFLLIKEWEN